MKKLFENIVGNQFKLLKEDIGGEQLVASGIKKVFANAHDTGQRTIPYDRIEAVGLGYIKDVSTAQKVAYHEAVQIADKFGYWDDTEHEQFALNDGTVSEHDETVMANPEGNVGETAVAGTDYIKILLGIIKQIPELSNLEGKQSRWDYIRRVSTNAEKQYQKMGVHGLNEHDEAARRKTRIGE